MRRCWTLTLGLILTWLSSATGSERYNVLVLYTDEHLFRTLSCYGGMLPGTPNIDEIARRGAIATRFYATVPVCSPSRAAFMTGVYPTTTGVTANNIPLPEQFLTFAQLLQRHGYATGYAGKWHLAGPAKPGWAPRPKFGFEDNRFAFNRGHWKQLADTPHGPRVATRNRQGRPTPRIAGANERNYTTDWLTEKAIQFIRAHKERPWCYMVSYPDPHGPNTVRPPYDRMFRPDQVRIPRTLRILPSRAPAWGRPDPAVTEQLLRRVMPAYYGMVKCIDDNIGRLLKELDALGLRDRTLIVFTSDHGDLCGEHGRLNKGVPFEGSARVPFLICAPGIVPAGTRVDIALGCVDFFPTLCGLLDLDPPQQVQGRDASGWFRGQPPPDWEDYTILRSASPPRWVGVVSGHYKLVLSHLDHPWLFDLSADPDELHNAWGSPGLDGARQRLLRHLRAYAEAVKDDYALRTLCAAAVSGARQR